MTDDHGRSRALASEEATDWLIRLHEMPDDPDVRQAFEAWCDASPVNASAWAETAHVSSAIGHTPAARGADWRLFVADLRASSSAGQPGSGTAPQAVKKSGRHSAVRIAALAAAACLAFIIAPGIAVEMQADHRTATAEVRTVTLADGSRVTLAPESAIRLDFGADMRDLEILEGEAFFEVEPDPVRPFRVTARDTRATVLGTAFDVRLGDAVVAVAVQHGRVRVDYGQGDNRSETLTAGQGLRVAEIGDAQPTGLSAIDVAAWRQHQLIAQDRPLGDVIGQLGRYVPGAIVVTSGALAAKTVTGVYNLEDPVGAVRGVATAHGASVRQITPWLLVVSAQ